MLMNKVVYQNKDSGLRTHSRYVGNIYLGLYNKKLEFNLSSTKYNGFPTSENQKILKKIGIISYTLRTIIEEKKLSEDDEEFVPLAISWLWIKGYYCIFHLMSIIIAYEKNDSRYILNRKYNSHNKIKNIINDLLAKDPFNISFLNSVFTGLELEKFTTKNHENLKTLKGFDDLLYKLSIKKVFKDEKSKIKDKRVQSYSFFSLTMNYRERFNYQGFHYLECDNEGDQEEIKNFYVSSYETISLISKALIKFLIKNTKGEIHDKLLAI